MTEQIRGLYPKGYVSWIERGSELIDDHEYLKCLTPNGWYELYKDPERAFELISGAMLEEEYALYNSGDAMRSETKLLFMVAPNLRDAQNIDGSRARRKKTDWAKASEHDELIAVLSNFIEEYPGTPPEKVYSEMADVFWNLIHLTSTDSAAIDMYMETVDQLAAAAGINRKHAGVMVIAKYQTRLYEFAGNNHHGIEDAEIARLMFGAWAGGDEQAVLPELNAKVASTVFDVVQKVIRIKLDSRLDQLRSGDVYKKIMAQAVLGVGSK